MIYLDNAATTLVKPAQVGNAVYQAMHTCANAGRGGHSASMTAANMIYSCRSVAAKFFGLESEEQVIFTFNATHALNIAIKGMLSKGGHCVISAFEHNSVVRPIKALEDEGVTFSVAHGRLFAPDDIVKSIKDAIRKDTVCVVCTHVSNVFGYRLPIEEIDSVCYQKGIPLIIDASQAAGVIDIKLNKLKACVCICMPGHKALYGPQGTGLLLVKPGLKLDSLIQGGTGSESSNLLQPDFLPDRHESGTLNVHGIAGLYEGIKFVSSIGTDKICEYEKKLVSVVADNLKGIKNIKLYLADDPQLQTGVLSFNIKDRNSEEIAYLLSERDIAVRGGLHCSPLAHKSALSIFGTVRISVSWFNDEQEIITFAKTVAEMV